MQQSIKTIRFYPPGGPDKLFFEETVVPAPAANQVPIKVHALPIIWPEITWPIYQDASGKYIPHTPGHDFSGTVASTGSDVTEAHLQPGQDVVAFTNRRNVERAMAQCAPADADQVVRKPVNLSHVEAASVPLCALTAWSALYHQARLRKGQTILITGAAGGTGLWLVQIAKHIGAHVIGTATRAESIKLLEEFGVDEAINVKNAPLRGSKRQFDVVVDCVGGATFEECLRAVEKDGVVVSIVEYDAKEKGASQGVEALFFIVDMDATQLDEIHRLIENESLRAVVDSVYDFEDIQIAWATCLEGHNRGKVVLRLKDA